MDWKKDSRSLVAVGGVFLTCFYLPVEEFGSDNALIGALRLARWYAVSYTHLTLPTSDLV